MLPFSQEGNITLKICPLFVKIIYKYFEKLKMFWRILNNFRKILKKFRVKFGEYFQKKIWKIFEHCNKLLRLIEKFKKIQGGSKGLRNILVFFDSIQSSLNFLKHLMRPFLKSKQLIYYSDKMQNPRSKEKMNLVNETLSICNILWRGNIVCCLIRQVGPVVGEGKATSGAEL